MVSLFIKSRVQDLINTSYIFVNLEEYFISSRLPGTNRHRDVVDNSRPLHLRDDFQQKNNGFYKTTIRQLLELPVAICAASRALENP
jgi:hypothetical protein